MKDRRREWEEGANKEEKKRNKRGRRFFIFSFSASD